jgi:PKD repeat protein
VATLNARASVVAATTNTTWATTANAVDGAFGVNSATYSVWTNTTANAVGTIELGFGSAFAGIPAGSVITNVAVTLRQLVSNATRVPTVTYQPFDGTTAIGTAAAATISTTAVSNTANFTPTLAQLKSATFKVRVSATRFNGTQAGTFSIDYVDVVVTYTPVPVANFTISDDTPNVSQVITFTDTSSDATSWAWDFGSGASPATANTQGPHNVTYSTAGTPNATLTVTNAAGSNGPLSKPLVVSGLPVAEVWNGTRWVVGGAEMWNGTSWHTDAEVWNGTRWVKLNSA